MQQSCRYNGNMSCFPVIILSRAISHNGYNLTVPRLYWAKSKVSNFCKFFEEPKIDSIPPDTTRFISILAYHHLVFDNITSPRWPLDSRHCQIRNGGKAREKILCYTCGIANPRDENTEVLRVTCPPLVSFVNFSPVWRSYFCILNVS